MTQSQDNDGIFTLFEQVLSQPPGKRAAALDTACAGDPVLRRRIERLLELADTDSGFLDHSPLGEETLAAEGEAHAAAGRTVGAYRLLRRLGTGGMAEVWLAERIEGGFHQQVAIKLIAHAPGSSAERFSAEREILASLDHSGIARLHDGGISADGVGWMAMEYVEGEHLDAWCRTRKLALAERLKLFLQVCDAVAYAHTRLVVHRDIKPANILVTAAGQAKLLDFGIAKLLGDDAVDAAGRATRTLLLSPSYAAPEQLDGRLVGTATDVYALGVTLYELLAERLPWASEATPMATALRRLLAAEPPPPSRVTAADAPVPARALHGDLDAIVVRALRREPEQRYPDARALADDIRRHLDHRPVQARVGARGYVVRRYLRRHWRGLALAAGVFLAMSAALVAIAWQAKKTKLEAQRAEAVQSFMVDLFRTNSSDQPDPVKARQTTARELLDIGAKRIGTELNDAPQNKLAMLRLFGDLYRDFDLAGDEAALRQQAVDLSRRVYGKDSLELAGDLLQQAWVNTDIDHDASVREIDDARAILDRRHDMDSFLRGRLLAIAAGNDSASDMARSRDEAAQAVAILDRYPESFELSDAVYTLAIAQGASGLYAPGMASMQRAIDILIRVKGSRAPELSFDYSRLAQMANHAQSHAIAIAAAQKAIDAAQAKGTERDHDWVRAQTVMAEALYGAERPRDALPFVARAKATMPPASETGSGLTRNTVHLAATRAQVQAGAPQAGLADAEAALADVRSLGRKDAFLALTLEFYAEALEESGKIDQMQQALDDSARIYRRIGVLQRERPLTLRIRAALDNGRSHEAHDLFTALPPVTGQGLERTANAIRRSLIGAEINLTEGKLADAAKAASATVAEARASELARYLPLSVADGELLEGLALARGGEAEKAKPILADALAVRTSMLLPQSPRIAEVQLALAECELALGRRGEAADLVAQAEAIEQQHGSLSARYRQPLARLRRALEKR